MQSTTIRGLLPAQYLNLMFQYLRSQYLAMFMLFLLLLSTIGLQILNPQILRYFIDLATAGGAYQTLIGIAVLFLSVAVIEQVISIATAYLSENASWIATNQLRTDLVLHCLQLDLSFHNAHTPGEFIERIDGDVNELANFFSLFIIQLLGNLLLIVGILVVLFLEDWRIGTGLMLYTLITLVCLSRVWPISVPSMKASREVSARLSGFLEERLAATEDIGANSGWDYVIQRLFQLFRERLHQDRKATITGALVIGTANILFVLCNAIGLGLGAYLYLEEAITIGTVYLVFRYTTLLFTPLHQITLQIDDLQKATASLHRIQSLFQIQSSIKEPLVSTEVDFSLLDAPMVQFQHISFSYTAGKPILRDLSFEVQSGQLLGLLGRTGSGKTTIARLLVRLYEPTTGTIKLNDVDTQQISPATLRDHIGFVTQDIQLFHATVRDNLIFYAPNIADEQIVEVFKALGLFTWYLTLPAGLDTQLHPGKISAGEAQLLAFARIFLRNPGLVVLDEASSRLDPATEQRLELALDKLLQGRTGIIIAHRLATVQRVDQIMILDQGQVLEYGQRQVLAADPTSRFSRLLQTGLNLTEAAEVVLS